MILVIPNRQEVEALTYHEVVKVLAEVEYQKQDQRTWEFSLKGDKPFEAYREITDEIEAQLSVEEGPSIDEHPMKDWFRAT